MQRGFKILHKGTKIKKVQVAFSYLLPVVYYGVQLFPCWCILLKKWQNCTYLVIC